MPCYRLQLHGREQGEAYWLAAESERDARRLLAANVAEAGQAEDASRFDCEISAERRPPAGLIHRRFGGPITMRKS